MTTSHSGDRPLNERYHHGDLRRALLRSAEAALAHGGAAALSLREIARAAGVSHAAPYRHFPDRNALLAALAAEGFRRLAAALEAAVAAAPAGEAMRAAGRAYLDFAAAHRALYLLMFGADIRKSAHPALAEASAAAMAALRAAQGATAGESANARHTAVGAWALVHGLAHLIADGQIAADLGTDGYAALADEAMAVYAAGLRAQGRQAR